MLKNVLYFKYTLFSGKKNIIGLPQKKKQKNIIVNIKTFVPSWIGFSWKRTFPLNKYISQGLGSENTTKIRLK